MTSIPAMLGAALRSFRLSAPVLWGAFAVSVALGSAGALASAGEPGWAQETVLLDPEEVELIDLDRRRGRLRVVIADLDEIIDESIELGGDDEAPGDRRALWLRALARRDASEWAGAEADARAAFRATSDDPGAPAEELSRTARTLASILVQRGRASEALEVFERAGGAVRPDVDARDAWGRGSARLELGQRAEAMADFELGAIASGTRTWDVLLDQARCQRALGRFQEAASTLVAADRLAKDGLGVEPDVLVELGEVYFEVYGETSDALSRAHSPSKLYEEALRLHPEHEGARLALFELYSFNWRLSRRSPPELLAEVFAARPRSIDGHVAAAGSAIDDGDLQAARRSLDKLEKLAPGRRDVRAEQAALAWIEGREADARGLLDGLIEEDGGDSRPELAVGQHLLELYRFAEGLPFLERAAERNPKDWEAWTQLGRAQANTGNEDDARRSLENAERVADGRRNAWRDNMRLVLRRMEESLVEHRSRDLTFLWMPDAAPVLERYLVPFYQGAREELSDRYGFTPGPVKIEVFRDWTDFSVRSTGFEGYPALGVCFGPVVTAVSPLAQLRGQFSWARTSYHEFTHVVHLGLSHNRCPRWITEGLATWEEGEARGSWWRNLRREMLDARANDEIVPVRKLNAAFRGPRVVFAYYQSGLLCKMLIEEHGFSPMVRLLEAFDDGADLDRALGSVFGKTPEEMDEAFLAFVDAELGDLAIEPRWSQASTVKRRFRASRTPPDETAARDAWVEEWCRIAWGAYWNGDVLDAQEALRLASTGGKLPPRGLFLRGELELGTGAVDQARRSFRAGFEAGGEDFRARMALAALLIRADELEEAETHLAAAERAFPGYDDPRLSAELRLAELFDAADRPEEAHEARLRWLAWNAGDYDVRVEVAGWLVEEGRFEEAAQLFEEANQVDPFRRQLHLEWGKALRELGRHTEALREFEVGLLVPAALDLDVQMARGLAEIAEQHSDDALVDLTRTGAAGDLPLDTLQGAFDAAEPLLHGYRALTLLDLGRAAEATEALEEALALDPECAPALQAREQLP